MRTIVTAAFLSLLLVGGAVCASPGAPPVSMEQPEAVVPPPYTSASGRFSVQFPAGALQQDSREIALRGGGASQLHQVWVAQQQDSAAYMVMYNDYPSDYATDSPQQVLLATRDGAAGGRKIVSDRVIELNGVPGRAFTVSGDGWVFTIRQFLAGKRLYQLIVVSDTAHPAPHALEFMRSFRIL